MLTSCNHPSRALHALAHSVALQGILEVGIVKIENARLVRIVSRSVQEMTALLKNNDIGTFESNDSLSLT
jgi:hypothetical protein